MSVEFNKEYELGDFVYFANEKINAEKVSQEKYISTENMVLDRGGVEKASKLPSVLKFNSFQKTDTLFSNIRTYFRKVWMASFDGGASADVLVFRTKDENVLDPAYLYYLISNKDFSDYSVLTAKGVKMPRGDKTAMMQYKFLLPDPEKQLKYALILKSIDHKIENNRRMNETLEGMAQAIFKSWFVDFDPVHAKVESFKNSGSEEDARIAAMCAISGKTADALAQLKSENPDDYAQLASTADAFPSTFTDSPLGQIPKGWEVKNISDFGKVICGKTPSKSNKEYYGSDVPFIKIPDMHSNVFATQTTDSLSAKGAQSQKNKFVPKGSICVSCIATVGKVVIASQESQTNQQINSIIPDKAEYSYFLFFAMKSLEKVFHDLASGGSATLNMNTSTFSKVQLIKPEENILEIYHSCIEESMYKILQNDLENQSLAETRDALLPKLLSGEIDVSALSNMEDL